MIPPIRLVHMLALSGLLGELRPDQLRRLDDDEDEPRDEPPRPSYPMGTRVPALPVFQQRRAETHVRMETRVRELSSSGDDTSETSHSRLQAMRANQEIKNERQRRRKLSKRREQAKARKKK